MTLSKILLTWMVTEDRTPSYLADKAKSDVIRMVDLIAGDAIPGADEIAALARATGLPVEDLSRETQGSPDAGSPDPLRCYTVAEAAALLGIGADTVRKEIKGGSIAHVVLGERATRIPRWALEKRLSAAGRNGPVAADRTAGTAARRGNITEGAKPRQGDLL